MPYYSKITKNTEHIEGRAWWHTLLTPRLRRQSQADICVFEVNLFYTSARPAKGYIVRKLPERRTKLHVKAGLRK